MYHIDILMQQYFNNNCFLQMCTKKVSLYPNSVKSLMKNYAEGSTIHGIFKYIVNALVQLINFTHKKAITSRAGDSSYY